MLTGQKTVKAIEFLPTPDEREWLVDVLVAIRRRCGIDTILSSILVEPDAVYFPDPWLGGQASIERLAHRVLHFAGIAEVAVAIEVLGTEGGIQTTSQHSSLRGNLAGCVERDRDGRFRILVHQQVVKDSVVLVAVLARCVAHIYAFTSGLVNEEIVRAEASDPKIDVIAAYLGFSIIMIHGDNRIRQIGRGTTRTEMSMLTLGRLPNVAMAYLLSIQLMVRQLDKKSIGQVARRLAPNDAACLNSAAVELDHRIATIRDELELPSPENWPRTRELSDYVAKLGPEEGNSVQSSFSEHPLVQEDRGIVGRNAGKPVFRVQRRMLGRMMKVALSLGFLIGMVSRGFPGLEMDAASYALCFIAFIVIAGLLGLIISESRCSDPKCEQKLNVSMRECPRCGGKIVGRIRHPNQRLAAEESYLQEIDRRDPDANESE